MKTKILSSLGLLAALPALTLGCGVQDTPPSDGGELEASMAQFEAMKHHKVDDGSVVRSLPIGGSVDALEGPPDLDALAPSPGWSLILEPTKDTYLLGEPVYVQVTMINQGEEAMKVAPLLKPEFQWAHYLITDPDGNQFSVRPQGEFCALPLAHQRWMEPGDAVSEEIKLWLHRGGIVFDQPGDYTLQVQFTGAFRDSRFMRSAPKTIHVLAGTPREQSAARLMTRGEAAQVIEWGQGDHLRDGLATLVRVTEEYPDTLHALYAHHVLGTTWGRAFFDGRQRRPADPHAAIPHLEVVRRALIDGHLPEASAAMRSSTFELLAVNYQTLGRIEEARATLRQFIEYYGEVPELRESVQEARHHLATL